MNATSDLPTSTVQTRSDEFSQNMLGAITWEYRFLVQEQWSSEAGGLTELGRDGWCVVSYGIRRDNQREYLLKRPRK